MNIPKTYHYKECGLANVHLFSGFELSGEGNDATVSFQNIDQLHTAINWHFMRLPHRFNGAELRYIRTELGLSPFHLADYFGVPPEFIEEWEGLKEIPSLSIPHECTLRMLLAEKLGHPYTLSTTFTEAKRVKKVEETTPDFERVPIHLGYHQGQGWTLYK